MASRTSCTDGLNPAGRGAGPRCLTGLLRGSNNCGGGTTLRTTWGCRDGLGHGFRLAADGSLLAARCRRGLRVAERLTRRLAAPQDHPQISPQYGHRAAKRTVTSLRTWWRGATGRREGACGEGDWFAG
jgi:hypothetical protein